MQNVATIDTQDPRTHEWHVIIETPKGSCSKFKYDLDTGAFMLSRVLPEGLSFPFDFGFLPSTVGEDGDPLDVLLLMDQPTFCGCLVQARLIGVIEAQQTETDGKSQRNDRLLAVPLKARRFQTLRSAKDLDKQMVKEVERFFQTYNDEDGKKFKLLGIHGPNRAEALVKNGMKEFRRQQDKTSKGKR